MKFDKEHEWCKEEGDIISIGISSYAVKQLGDITFIEMPEIGSNVSKGDSVAFVESVKAASDIYTPISGEIVAINEDLEDEPQKLNEDAYDNFIFKIKPSNIDELDTLMSEDEYNKYLDTL